MTLGIVASAVVGRGGRTDAMDAMDGSSQWMRRWDCDFEQDHHLADGTLTHVLMWRQWGAGWDGRAGEHRAGRLKLS